VPDRQSSPDRTLGGLILKSSRGILVCLLLLLGAGLASAQEVTLFGGSTTSIDLNEKTYAWKLDYRQGLAKNFEFSFSWLNEGHVTNHHRDGYTIQLWLRDTIFDNRLSLALGAGPFRYYDTATANTVDGYSDVHGFAGLFSLDAAYYIGKRWILRSEVNRSVAGSKSIDTWDFMIGLGYQLSAPDSPGPRDVPPRQAEPTTNNEITLFLGRTVVNSFESQKSVAGSLEYRRGLSRYFDVSASFLYEGDSDVVRRGGFIVQGWFGRAFFNDHLALSVGGGLYIAVDKRHIDEPGDKGGTLAGIVTPSVSYRFGEHWDTRFSWNRILTTYDKDTDVFQLGLGYRF
jgi:hypothetical protein